MRTTTRKRLTTFPDRRRPNPAYGPKNGTYVPLTHFCGFSGTKRREKDARPVDHSLPGCPDSPVISASATNPCRWRGRRRASPGTLPYECGSHPGGMFSSGSAPCSTRCREHTWGEHTWGHPYISTRSGQSRWFRCLSASTVRSADPPGPPAVVAPVRVRPGRRIGAPSRGLERGQEVWNGIRRSGTGSALERGQSRLERGLEPKTGIGPGPL